MKKYTEMTIEELQEEKDKLAEMYKKWQKKDLSLDMSRGKPSVEQLDLSMPILDILDGKSKVKV